MDLEYNYDLIVIGGGSGGQSCAKKAANLGKKVALCDFVKPSPQGTKWGLGGTCVNVGCIPKKLMHFTALLGELKHDTEECGWGIDSTAGHNWDKMIKNVNNHVKSLNWGYKVSLLENEVKYFNKLASFEDDHTVILKDAKGVEEKITGKDILIAVGGRPTQLDLPGFKEHSINSDDLFWQKKAPGKTQVIGAGYIAMECGGFIKGMGNDVTVLIRSVPLRNFDQDMVKRCIKNMESMGVNFISNYDSSSGSIVKDETTGKLKVTYLLSDKGEQVEEFDTVLVAIGRGADVELLNLKDAGVDLNKWNKIPTDAENRTNVSNIYAIGDVIENSPELTPVAIQEGTLLADRLYNNKTKKMNYDMIATTIFTPQEYSCVGLSEEAATKKYGEENLEVYHTSFKPLEWNFLKTRDNSLCYVKVICLLNDNLKVVGMHYCGPNAGEVMQGYAVALMVGMTYEHLQDTVGIHPTTSEEFTNLTVTKREAADAQKTGC